MKTKAIVCCREWLLEAYYLRMFMQLSNIHSSLYYSSEVYLYIDKYRFYAYQYNKLHLRVLDRYQPSFDSNIPAD